MLDYAIIFLKIAFKFVCTPRAIRKPPKIRPCHVFLILNGMIREHGAVRTNNNLWFMRFRSTSVVSLVARNSRRRIDHISTAKYNEYNYILFVDGPQRSSSGRWGAASAHGAVRSSTKDSTSHPFFSRLGLLCSKSIFY